MTEAKSSQFNIVDISVNGHPVQYSIDELLNLDDTIVPMSLVASMMGWWANVWAEAEAEFVLAEAFYEQWEAAEGEAVLAAHKDISEWRKKQAVAANPKQLEYKKAIALAKRNVTIARGVFQSLQVKASLLQSKSKKDLASLPYTGATDTSQPPEKVKQGQERMRGAFKKG